VESRGKWLLSDKNKFPVARGVGAAGGRGGGAIFESSLAKIDGGVRGAGGSWARARLRIAIDFAVGATSRND
jgi:hypothetical protein